MKRKPAYLIIREQLTNLIRANSGQKNFRLPSEQQICTKFQVSRITAKRVLNDLVEEGLVYRIQGKGTFLSPALSENTLSTVSQPKLLRNTHLRVIFPTTDSNYMRQLLFGIIYTLREFDITPQILYSCQDSEYEDHLIRSSINSYCSGIILYPVDYEKSNKELFQLYLKKIPVVYVDRIPIDGALSYVIPDHYGASLTVTKFLIEKGYRNLCFVISGNDMLSSINLRLKGFNQALEECGIPFSDYNFLNISEVEYEGVRRQMRAFLCAHPQIDGIILPEGIVSTALSEILNETGRRPIDDVGIVTYDREIPDYNNPLLRKTLVVDQCPLHLGRAAAESIVSLILHQKEVCEVVYPCNIGNRDIFDKRISGA